MCCADVRIIASAPPRPRAINADNEKWEFALVRRHAGFDKTQRSRSCCLSVLLFSVRGSTFHFRRTIQLTGGTEAGLEGSVCVLPFRSAQSNERPLYMELLASYHCFIPVPCLFFFNTKCHMTGDSERTIHG